MSRAETLLAETLLAETLLAETLLAETLLAGALFSATTTPTMADHDETDFCSLIPISSQADRMPDTSLLRYVHEFRIAYHQTDGQRRVHHSNYLNYFEDARVEMLRAGGIRYKDVEDSGRLLVVTEMNVRYHAAAEFDDWLRLDVRVTEIRKVRLRHRYDVYRGDTLIASAESTIACVGPDGRPKKLPDPFLALADQVPETARADKF